MQRSTCKVNTIHVRLPAYRTDAELQLSVDLFALHLHKFIHLQSAYKHTFMVHTYILSGCDNCIKWHSLKGNETN